VSNLPILYSFRRCPYAIRARYALAHKNITYILREVDLKNKPEAMLDISPKGSVPVMLLPDGTVIDESLDIISYAWSVNVSSELIKHYDNDFTPLLKKYKYFEHHPEHTQNYYRTQIESNFLTKINTILEKHHYLTGDTLTPDDIAIIPFIRQFVFVDKEWFDDSDYTYIKNWLYSIINTAIFDSVMQKFSPWKEEDNEIVIAS